MPGGSGNLTKGHPFYDNTEYLLKLAMEANDDGDYFPVCPLLTTKCASACMLTHHTHLHMFMRAIPIATVLADANFNLMTNVELLPVFIIRQCQVVLPCTIYNVSYSVSVHASVQVHGTCLGLEVLSIIASQNTTLLTK